MGCSAFARRYLRNRTCFLFLGVLRWFTSPRWPSRSYVFTSEWRSMTSAGFSHSEIPGSKPVCGSPRLIAAGRVLPRLSAPRHPPCTLSSLTKVKDCTLETSTLRFSHPPSDPRAEWWTNLESFTFLGFDSVVKDLPEARAPFRALRRSGETCGNGRPFAFRIRVSWWS